MEKDTNLSDRKAVRALILRLLCFFRKRVESRQHLQPKNLAFSCQGNASETVGSKSSTNHHATEAEGIETETYVEMVSKQKKIHATYSGRLPEGVSS